MEISNVSTSSSNLDARERFRRSLTRAQMADLLALVTGGNSDLVSYHEVANHLKARQQIEMGTQMVSLRRIVGSVGRYRDFTRTFMPRSGIDEERWARLDAAMNSPQGVPPVDLFKIGEVYFVRDGNHRVSVARANDLTHIEAYVTEVKTDIPLTLEDFDHDEWLVKADHQDFMRQTGLNRLRPDNGIYMTEPGRYEMMLRHIHVHWYLTNERLEREDSDEFLEWPDAVESWYDNVYLPVVEAIHKYHLMEDFPHRTEADLYMWIAYHREELSLEYELAPLSPDEAVSTFAQVYSETLMQKTMKGLRLGLHRVFGPDNKPLGMSEESYQELRNRHAAGEISLAEAEAILEEQAEQEEQDAQDEDGTEEAERPQRLAA